MHTPSGRRLERNNAHNKRRTCGHNLLQLVPAPRPHPGWQDSARSTTRGSLLPGVCFGLSWDRGFTWLQARRPSHARSCSRGSSVTHSTPAMIQKNPQPHKACFFQRQQPDSLHLFTVQDALITSQRQKRSLKNFQLARSSLTHGSLTPRTFAGGAGQ